MNQLLQIFFNKVQKEDCDLNSSLNKYELKSFYHKNKGCVLPTLLKELLNANGFSMYDGMEEFFSLKQYQSEVFYLMIMEFIIIILFFVTIILEEHILQLI